MKSNRFYFFFFFVKAQVSLETVNSMLEMTKSFYRFKMKWWRIKIPQYDNNKKLKLLKFASTRCDKKNLGMIFYKLFIPFKVLSLHIYRFLLTTIPLLESYRKFVIRHPQYLQWFLFYFLSWFKCLPFER